MVENLKAACGDGVHRFAQGWSVCFCGKQASYMPERAEGREGMVTVYDSLGNYCGCMGVERWEAILSSTDAQKAANGRYRTIVVDPPWPYPEGFARNVGGRYADGTQEGWSRRTLPYASATLAEIADVDVRGYADRDCRLWLWATNRYLHDAFHVIEAWGFTYRQTIIWHKTGNPNPWIAHIAPAHSEFLLVAVRGKPERLASLPSSVLSVDANPARLKHSQKPEAFLDYIEAVSPPPRLEMFSRRDRLGWDTFGDESLGTCAA